MEHINPDQAVGISVEEWKMYISSTPVLEHGSGQPRCVGCQMQMWTDRVGCDSEEPIPHVWSITKERAGARRSQAST